MRFGVLLLATAILGAGCREGDGPSGPVGSDVRLHIVSDPSGARILLDDEDLDRVTPDTLDLRSGEHTLGLRLDSAGYVYGYDAVFRITPSDEVATLVAPLAVQCPVDFATACYAATRRHYAAAGMRFATSARGSLFHWDGNGQGIFFPDNSVNSYAASGIPVVAGTINTQHVAIGPYDHALYAGRPAPSVVQADGRFERTHTAWIVPPLNAARRLTTVRGLELTQTIIARDDVAQTLLLRLQFRNISNEQLYYDYATYLEPTPLTIQNAFVGFLLDPDIGVANDDWMSYDAELDMVYAYDTRFNEPLFVGAGAAAPALVGMRALRIPPGTTVQLNGWTNRPGFSGDWNAGTNGETIGYGVLTGSSSYAPAHADPEIGHLPTDEGDVRLSLTAGPLTLAPGETAEIILAIAVAAPAEGAFTFDVPVAPGDPLDTSRQLYRIAAPLRERMRAAEALLDN